MSQVSSNHVFFGQTKLPLAGMVDVNSDDLYVLQSLFVNIPADD
jgi:hypothetical protein